MKSRYTNKDIDRFFSQMKNLTDYFQIEKVQQIISNPSIKIHPPTRLWSNLISGFTGIIIVSFIVIVLINRNHKQPAQIKPAKSKEIIIPPPIKNIAEAEGKIDSCTEVKETASEATFYRNPCLDSLNKVNIKPVQTSLDNDLEKDQVNSRFEKESLLQDTFRLKQKKENPSESSKATKDQNIKGSNFNRIRTGNINLNDFDLIETSGNYFLIDTTKHLINSQLFFNEANSNWKFELDLHSDSNNLYINLISRNGLGDGIYIISDLKINDMPVFSCYGALSVNKQEHKFKNAKVIIKSFGPQRQVLFIMETEQSEIISGHYKGELK